MKATEILLKKMEEKGIEGGEVLAQKMLGAIEETLAEAAVSTDVGATEKGIAVVLSTVFAGFKASLMSLIDFNKDGKIG